MSDTLVGNIPPLVLPNTAGVNVAAFCTEQERCKGLIA